MENSSALAHDSHDSHQGVHLAESPLVMVLPMALLGVAAAALGYMASPPFGDAIGVAKHWLTGFLADGLLASLGGEGHAELADFNWWVAVISSAAAVAGGLLAVAVYSRRRAQESEPLEIAGPLHTLLFQKYFVDALYENVIVRRGFYRIVAGTLNWLDRRIVDGLVDLVGWFFRNIGSAIARLQSGQVQAYGAVVAFGTLIIILAFLLA